jgi:hypothetical protein
MSAGFSERTVLEGCSIAAAACLRDILAAPDDFSASPIGLPLARGHGIASGSPASLAGGVDSSGKRRNEGDGRTAEEGFRTAGEVHRKQSLIRNILSLGDCLTVTGRTIAENLDQVSFNPDADGVDRGAVKTASRSMAGGRRAEKFDAEGTLVELFRAELGVRRSRSLPRERSAVPALRGDMPARTETGWLSRAGGAAETVSYAHF